MSYHPPYPTDPAALAYMDQAIAELRATVVDLAEGAVTSGRRCCRHPLCPGTEILTQLIEGIRDEPASVVGIAASSIRLLGEYRMKDLERKARR